jgi:hypothetical protein
MKNGDYLIVCEDKVIVQLGSDSDKAVESLYRYYLNNSRVKPDAYLVQVVASLEYSPPEVRTLAHERMT